MKLSPELDLQRYKQEKEAGHSLCKGIHPDRFWPSAGERHGSLSAEGKPPVRTEDLICFTRLSKVSVDLSRCCSNTDVF